MDATDKGNPTRSSKPDALVTVNVIRNLNTPIFEGEPYTADVSYKIASGDRVTSVFARDDDTVVSTTQIFNSYSNNLYILWGNLYHFYQDAVAIKISN